MGAQRLSRPSSERSDAQPRRSFAARRRL